MEAIDARPFKEAPPPLPAQARPAAGAGWRAVLSLGFARGRTGATILAGNRHRGPLMVQKPFYPEGAAVCHTIVVHPPGGVVGGDRLEVTVRAAAGSHALVTTPAAAKFYRSDGPRAEQVTRLTVEAGGLLEWLPQETIMHDGARAALRTEIDLDERAGFIGWDIVCLGLPAARRPFATGRIDQMLAIRRGGRPLLFERGLWEGGEAALSAPWGLGGAPVFGLMAATDAGPEAVEAVRRQTRDQSREEIGPKGSLFAVTRVEGLLLCRFAGRETRDAMKYFIRAWEVLRPVLAGRPACRPRIWQT